MKKTAKGSEENEGSAWFSCLNVAEVLSGLESLLVPLLATNSERQRISHIDLEAENEADTLGPHREVACQRLTMPRRREKGEEEEKKGEMRRKR